MSLVLEKQREKCSGSIDRELIHGEIGEDFTEEMLIVLGPEGRFSMIRVTKE